MSRWASEFFGTFTLVLCGGGAIVVGSMYPGMIPHTSVALVFGITVMVMIYSIGDLSGAHINPAVTIGFWLARRMPGRAVLPYLISQFAGATAASYMISRLLPGTLELVTTTPAVSPKLAFCLEALASFILMFVIIHVSQGAREKGIMAGIAIGGTVMLEALVLGPLTGASMNPARSLGPALMSGTLEHLWIYLLAPIIGAALAILSCLLLRNDCCALRSIQEEHS